MEKGCCDDYPKTKQDACEGMNIIVVTDYGGGES
jgi:hypothetical protein